MKLYRVMMKLFSNVVRECERRPFFSILEYQNYIRISCFLCDFRDFEVPTLMILTLIWGGSCLH